MVECSHRFSAVSGCEPVAFTQGEEDNPLAETSRPAKSGRGGSMSRTLRAMESEDSSYDSDVETHQAHEDVSRTASETLAAEYADYVTADPGYPTRVEFGLKLGYTEAQVLAAHQKLGARPSQNELLAELIKLGARASRPPPGTSQGDDLAVAVPSSISSSSSQSITSISSSSPGHPPQDDSSQLRPIVIDGSNVAISHGNKEFFSCRGIQLCVEWFKARGHREITVFVPRWRKEAAASIRDQDILVQLEKERRLVFTPSRTVPGGKRLVCYDDRYVLNLAAQVDGVVVSNDNYRDLVAEKPEFKKVVEERLLMYSFVNDRFMPPEDPLGRHGPDLDTFLKKQPAPSEPLPPPCPYGKKCTYGNKCKYYHPERGNQPQKTITERLAEQAKLHLQEVKSRGLATPSQESEKAKGHSEGGKVKKTPLARTKSLVPQPTIIKESVVEKSSLPEGILAYSSNPTSKESSFSKPHSASDPWDPSTKRSSSSSWATLSSTLPKNIVGSQAELFLEPDAGGGHLAVAKRLSDPDKSRSSPQPQHQLVPPSSLGAGTSHFTSEENLHRKLQRQLTLNPTYDPRLVRDYSGGPQRLLSPQPEQFRGASFHHTQMDPSILRASSQENLKMAFRGGTVAAARKPNIPSAHRQVARLNSDGRLATAVPPHVWEHPNVTRISSAPDSFRQWPPMSARMQRLNSTSDTRLNLFADLPTSQSLHTSFHHPSATPHYPSWSAASEQSTLPGAILAPWPPPTGDHHLPHSQNEDPRSKLYYHLSSIFPEEQVRAAMDLYPEETNAQKICAAILTLFPKG